MYSLKYVSDNGNVVDFHPMGKYVITKTQGMMENSVKISTSQGMSQIGSYSQGQSVQSKSIVIEGAIKGVAESAGRHLLNTIVPQMSGTLIYNDKIMLRVIPEITPKIEQYPTNPNFIFTVFAEYPYWQSTDSVQTNVAGMEPRFRFPINYSNTYFEDPLTHMFGQRTKTFFTNIFNFGNVPAPFKIIFLAKTQLSNPMITKVVDGLPFLKISKDLVAGEKITIDMTSDTLTVTTNLYGAETDAFNFFDIDSTIFKLDVGDNLIRYDADVNRDGLECIISYNPTYTGAYGHDIAYI